MSQRHLHGVPTSTESARRATVKNPLTAVVDREHDIWFLDADGMWVDQRSAHNQPDRPLRLSYDSLEHTFGPLRPYRLAAA